MNPSEEQKGANASAAGDASSAGPPEVLKASPVSSEPAVPVVQPADPLDSNLSSASYEASYEDGYPHEPEAVPVAAPVRPAPPPRPPAPSPSTAVTGVSRRPGG